ncbi:DNA-binding transcriptional regulator, LysR family [Micromonospora phaseoli]|uniref:DNA-binding transcriptional regulator, LysR family n=1 Tax=Micromonospora phaseoli TaxID=1144548 RepID=A0A1H6S455_9ACTN|nr:LysR substrate-binding domain-containing protein [Micromonospora phaseoli]PZW03802.1 DNA-binding transcriptional LysR family regulator [Micromonospora phaseoli]GIJ79103.1 LysR family transcriptional regulator [Micromonospora phaseoli]SEI62908.1 DNA-binding transcriptional regulator, LysR family [Micromonospora phaseoli]
MLERHEIETFLTLADELHFGRTAERLRVTTGRISHVIRKLERRVGAPLFERTSRVVRITPIGRQLADDLAPVVEQMDTALRRAIEAGRGVTGQLRVAFLGEYLAPVLLKAVKLFTARHPDCDVDVREVQLSSSRASLLDGSIDILVASYPFDGMARGPALMVERRVLAVAVTHPLADAESVSLEVLADHPVVQYPAITSAAFKRDRTPEHTPSGRMIPKGPHGNTFSEMLSLVAMGRGVLPVGEQTEHYHPRPDIAYVPIHDAPPIERGPIWLEANTTTRVQEFVQAATDANTPHPRARTGWRPTVEQTRRADGVV